MFDPTTAIQNQPVRIGKRAPRLDPRTFRAERFLPAVLPKPSHGYQWDGAVATWPMLLNDNLGCCVPAASGHMIQQWTAYTGSHIVPSDGQILKAYEDIGGYVPGDPSTDNGCVMLDALNYWRQTGIAGHKILAYIKVDLKKTDQVRLSIELFGNLYLGIQLPISAQGAGKWTVPPGGPVGDGSPGSWGGHCLPIVAYNPRVLTVVTWGSLLPMTWEFMAAYADEAYCVLSQDWIDNTGIAPSKFALAQLQADLTSL